MTQTSISRRKNTVFFRKDGRIILLDIHDIIYIEHHSRTIFLHTVRGVFLIPYMTLCAIHERLGNDFLCQCHKSLSCKSNRCRAVYPFPKCHHFEKLFWKCIRGKALS